MADLPLESPERALPTAHPGTSAAEIPATIQIRKSAASPAGDGTTSVRAITITAPSDDCLTALGDYDLLGEIARGGMGIVYKARQRKLNRIVALKVTKATMLMSLEEARRFRMEASAAAKLDHPNIVPIYEVGEANGRQFFSMALVEGDNLHDTLADGPLPPRRAAELVKQVADAVAYAHGQGVIHRDLKPSNILLDTGGQARVTDFGLAKSAETDSNLTQAGAIMGTPSFMPPEQGQGDMGQVGPLADVYSLGATLYCLVTGRPPFQAATPLETLKQVVDQEPVSPRRLNPAVDRDLDTICLKCLQKTPERRYASAAALGEDLQRFLEGRPIQARAITPLEKMIRWRRRNPQAAASLAAAVVIVLAAFAMVTRSYVRADKAYAEEQEQRREAERKEKAERWERYRANIAAAASALHVHNVGAARRALEAAPEDFRDWEWRYFQNQLDSAQHVVHWDNHEVSKVKMTPDGRWAAVYTEDDSVRVWDAVQRKEVRTFSKAPHLANAAVSPDGKTFAYPDQDFSICLRDVATDRVRAVLRGHERFVHALRFSADSSRLASGSDDQTARVWDAQTGEMLQVVRSQNGALDALGISTDGQRFVTLQRGEGTIRMWDVSSGREIAATRGSPTDVIHGVFYPQDFRFLWTEYYPSNAPRLWQTAPQQKVTPLEGHTNQVTFTTIRADGKRIATCSKDSTVRLWNGADGAPLANLDGHRGWAWHTSFSPDGQRLLSAAQDQTVRIWDANSGAALAVLQGHTDEVFAAAYVGDSGLIVSASRDGSLRWWDPESNLRNNYLRGHTNFVYSAAFHPDGIRVASAAWDGTVRIWDATTGRQLSVLNHDHKTVFALAMHPGGRLLATGTRDSTIRLWDLNTGKVVARWGVAMDGWRDARLAFNHDGSLLASGSNDRTVRLWKVEESSNGQDSDGNVPVVVTEAATLSGHRDMVRDVVFSPDGRWLASSGDTGDSTVRIWDVNSGKTVQVLQGHRQVVYTLAWSRDGKWLASGSTDGTVRLWDTATWNQVAVLKHGVNVYGLAFTPDSARLACGCADNTIHLWDVAKQQEVAELRGHRDYVHSLAFSPDGSRFVSASGDFTLRVWDTLSAQERAKKDKSSNNR